MRFEDHIAHFVAEAHLFADAVARADLDVTVVTCPDWSVRDLAQHVGRLYRWSSTIVEKRVMTALWPRELSYDEPTGADGWAEWVRAGVEPAAAVFRDADPSDRVWVWGADPHVRFWPRRMIYESVIHRCDVAATMQEPIDVSPEVAVEGIDEWLENLLPLKRWQPPTAQLAGESRQLSFASEDTGDTWRVVITPPGGWFWDRGSERGGVHVSGSAADLLLLMLGRPANVRNDGDEAILRGWLDASKFD